MTPDGAAIDAWTRVATQQLESRARIRKRIAEQEPTHVVNLWLVRHGETTTNAAGLFTGVTDSPLTIRGRLQAQQAGRAISGQAFDIGFASNLQRSYDTLELMAHAGGLAVACTVRDARLAERSFGELERTQIRPRDPRLAVDLQIAPTGGESYVALARRCLSFLLDLRELSVRLGRPLDALISTHTGPMRVITAILDQATDPVVVRERRFENGAVVAASLGELAWPDFAGGLPGGDAAVSR